ncbi:actin-related protein 2/3 complex subunit 1A-A [Parasteatoda tepidariorum]|uniref:actin-related protein 2/3 complex subunit 1A-A n=1 Tax=Parasteatoda tepidariorum TaxID=114398 RepID=UPI00077F8CFD|nr:actin-related protein 2/3 complex subunit 1A-A [Parasteatoda tepidariorum]XP_015921777.1 actin-related protein 2/3 complex subunit 1A-A [Parasteatoda tepidariorum]XP_042900384.1 actin-related protein 2/3 complex subunit 1A-A [Parasteatoda tepidariorum]XP_042900386.1 actin-related protein 2/3 complex subunit 1A-A [Parasteatoda tepidariorum]
MTEIHSFGVDPITCHAWNNDRTQIALSPNNNEVHIYKREGDNWSCKNVLTQHDLRVTSIDWAPNTNRIVTCSADRNAYVWTKANDKWKPTLVLLRINRAATCVRWSPNETKFAVGCGARLISVCFFEEENDWWLSKHIKKPIKSTVTSLDWHPNNVLLACGSTDFKTRVFSAYVKEIDSKPEPTVWGFKMPLGHVMAEFSNSGWVHCVSFSADGSKLVWVSHDSTVSICDAEKNMALITVKTQFLPYLACAWTSNSTIVAAGHDCCPMLFQYDGMKLTFVTKLDKSQKREVDGFSAMRKFRDMDKRAIVENSVDTLLDTIHQNAVTSLQIYAGSKTGVSKLCTTGIDGKMVIWNLKALAEALPNDI